MLDYKRIKIGAKQKLRVSFILEKERFHYYDREGNIVIYNGELELYPGLSAPLPETHASENLSRKLHLVVHQPE